MALLPLDERAFSLPVGGIGEKKTLRDFPQSEAAIDLLIPLDRHRGGRGVWGGGLGGGGVWGWLVGGGGVEGGGSPLGGGGGGGGGFGWGGGFLGWGGWCPFFSPEWRFPISSGSFPPSIPSLFFQKIKVTSIP